MSGLMNGIIAFLTNVGLPLAYILTIVAVIVAVVFPLISMFSDLAGAKKALMGFAGLAVLLLIGYVTAGSELPAYAVKHGVEMGQYKMISAGLTAAMIATVGCSIYVLVDLIISLVKG